jgi:conserved oligomeric Golgi complex subunit 2
LYCTPSDSPQFGDSGTESDNEDNDASTLPFPKPLAREAFLTPEFDAAEFLSNLSTRFQTLEDLQTELRELSQSLNKELVDLVNDNYQDFLTLGATLRGGDEKVEDIRVGLLGFQRDIAGLKAQLDHRRGEVQVLLDEKRNLMKETEKGRILLEIAERLEELEGQLGLAKPANSITNGNSGDDHEDTLSSDSEDDADEERGVSVRTKRRVEQYLILRVLMGKHDRGHPFLRSQQARVDQVKATLLLDLDTLSKQAQSAQASQALLQLRQTVGEH